VGIGKPGRASGRFFNAGSALNKRRSTRLMGRSQATASVRTATARPPWCGFLRRFVWYRMSSSSARRAVRGEWRPEHPDSGFDRMRQQRIGT
jgi:hypothetical protein